MDEKAVLFFLKFFSEEEHRNQFNSGKLFMSNIGYYASNEKERGKGRGDQNEGRVTLSNITEATVMDMRTKEEIPGLRISEVTFGSKEIDKIHVFCCTYVPIEWIKFKNDDYQNGKLEIPERTLQKMKKEYGNYVSVIVVPSFINSIEEYGRSNDTTVNHGPVEYADLRRKENDRFENFINSDSKFIFQKDLIFKDEFEYRLAFLDLLSDKSEIIDLGKEIDILEEIITVDDLIEKIKNERINIYMD